MSGKYCRKNMYGSRYTPLSTWNDGGLTRKNRLTINQLTIKGETQICFYIKWAF